MGGMIIMLPVIEVQCPFCKATGQIMTPPLGSIIVGPCPRCNETVLLFDGTVMALDKDILRNGTTEERKQHLLETIIDMVAEKVEELIESEELRLETPQGIEHESDYPDDRKVTPSIRDTKAPQISKEDVRDFVNIDLHLIDLKDYFERIFRKKRGSNK
jgi:hypothetical protein